MNLYTDYLEYRQKQQQQD